MKNKQAYSYKHLILILASIILFVSLTDCLNPPQRSAAAPSRATPTYTVVAPAQPQPTATSQAFISPLATPTPTSQSQTFTSPLPTPKPRRATPSPTRKPVKGLER